MSQTLKSIYLRVSRDDLDESTQLPIILKHFNLKESECIIFRERISAYKEEAQKDRLEFLELKSAIERQEISDIYVYSLERLERNIIRLFEFFFFCEANNCKIHGYLQPSLDLPFENTPIGTFSRYIQLLTFGLLGENESYMTSQRTKKAVETKKGITTSYKGNKWGRWFTDINGFKIKLSPDKAIKLRDRTIELNKSYSQEETIKRIGQEFNIQISKSWVSKVVTNGSR